jgi:probable rRNA maturation factor
MIEFYNRTTLKIDFDFIQNIADSLTSKNLELIITDSKEMQEINFTHRNIDKDTDVLSFPYEDMPMFPLGSIVICEDYILKNSKEFSHSIDNEFRLLFIHGLLHLLGYNHEVDNGEMRKKEEEIINKYKLPSSLIIRNYG